MFIPIISDNIVLRYALHKIYKENLEKELKEAVRKGDMEKAQVILKKLEQLKFHIIDPYWRVIR